MASKTVAVGEMDQVVLLLFLRISLMTAVVIICTSNLLVLVQNLSRDSSGCTSYLSTFGLPDNSSPFIGFTLQRFGRKEIFTAPAVRVSTTGIFRFSRRSCNAALARFVAGNSESITM